MQHTGEIITVYTTYRGVNNSIHNTGEIITVYTTYRGDNNSII